MPSLFRFLLVLLILAALGGGAILALALLVEPGTREMSITLPKDRFEQR